MLQSNWLNALWKRTCFPPYIFCLAILWRLNCARLVLQQIWQLTLGGNSPDSQYHYQYHLLATGWHPPPLPGNGSTWWKFLYPAFQQRWTNILIRLPFPSTRTWSWYENVLSIHLVAHISSLDAIRYDSMHPGKQLGNWQNSHLGIPRGPATTQQGQRTCVTTLWRHVWAPALYRSTSPAGEGQSIEWECHQISRCATWDLALTPTKKVEMAKVWHKLACPSSWTSPEPCPFYRFCSHEYFEFQTTNSEVPCMCALDDFWSTRLTDD